MCFNYFAVKSNYFKACQLIIIFGRNPDTWRLNILNIPNITYLQISPWYPHRFCSCSWFQHRKRWSNLSTVPTHPTCGRAPNCIQSAVQLGHLRIHLGPSLVTLGHRFFFCSVVSWCGCLHHTQQLSSHSKGQGPMLSMNTNKMFCSIKMVRKYLLLIYFSKDN